MINCIGAPYIQTAANIINIMGQAGRTRCANKKNLQIFFSPHLTCIYKRRKNCSTSSTGARLRDMTERWGVRRRAPIATESA
jgi:hypothetical protein